jgi:hypothetical protein
MEEELSSILVKVSVMGVLCKKTQEIYNTMEKAWLQTTMHDASSIIT